VVCEQNDVLARRQLTRQLGDVAHAEHCAQAHAHAQAQAQAQARTEREGARV
jgi:hypothetical protein